MPDSEPTRTLEPTPEATQTNEPVSGTGSDSAVPDRVGRFVVLGVLARGGMGVVYRAQDPALDREVALKLLGEQLAGRPEAVRRFLDEVRVTAQLQHPSIPPVHEVGTLPDGRPVEAIGRIAWSKRVLTPRERDVQAGIGIEFLGGAAEQFSALESYIDERIEAGADENAETAPA